jgi:dihydrofolate reductase
MTSEYPETVPTHVRAQAGLGDLPNKTMDTLVMGRGTYQPALDIGVTSPYAHLKQYVVSTTLEQAEDVELYAGDPIELVRTLKAQEGLDIYLCGGGKLAGTLLPEIDQLVVKSYPVVAGAGIPAFAGPFNPTTFTPTQTKSFANGATVTWFERS